MKMKTIVLVALLAAVGCSKKTSDCEVSIGKGMDKLSSMIKTRAPNPQMAETMTSMVGKLTAALVQRCVQDKWSPDALSCFATVSSRADEQACEAKLTEEQRTKLHTDLRQVAKDTRTPGGLTGHPPMLSGSGSGAAPAGSGATPAGSGATPSAAPVGAGSAPAGSGAAPAGSGAAPASGSPAPPVGANAK